MTYLRVTVLIIIKTGGLEYDVLTSNPSNHYKTGGLEYDVLTDKPSNHNKTGGMEY